ncbi:MAG: DNA-binding protein WhiA [Oscillospiraceae bacterium]
MEENFSLSIKSELCKKLTDYDKKTACLYGMLLFSHRFAQDEKTSFRTESKSVAELFPRLIHDILGGNFKIESYQKDIKGNSKAYYFNLSSQDVKVISKEFNINPIREIDLRNIDNNNMMSFISGAFLSCGSITNPNKEYHLEYSVSQELLSKDLLTILNSFGFNFKISKRRNFYIVYVKGSENIEDILTFMGAESSTLEIMNVKIFKDIQNRLNRRGNCEKANYNKIYNTGKKQFEDIEYIDATLGIENLPQNLIETAYVRLENPEMSLKELCEQFEAPIGRSGLSRRLQKISNIAQQLKDGTYYDS